MSDHSLNHQSDSSTDGSSAEEICARVRELIPGYVLDALDVEERALVDQHLSHCPQARADLADYAPIARGLLMSAPLVSAPPEVGSRLRVALEEAATARGRVDAPAPVPPSRWTRWWGMPRLGRDVLAPALVALLLVLLTATNLYWYRQVADLRQTQSDLARDLYEHETVLVVMGAGNAHRVELTPVDKELLPARAAVVFDPDRSRAFVYADDFPSLTEGQIYQLWLVRGNERTSGGLFTVRSRGSGTLYINAPDALGSYDAIEITTEPVGGSSAPTGPIIVRSDL